MKKFILLLMLSTTVSFCYGQYKFQRVYGSLYWDWAKDVLITPDQGYFIFGTSDINYSQLTFSYLVKTGKLGELKWAKIYTNPTGNIGFKIVNALDGNYFTLAQATANYTHYPVLCKIDDNGDVLYSKKYTEGPHSYPRDLACTRDGGTVIVGKISRTGFGAIFVLKTNFAGDVQWSKSYHMPESNQHVESIIETKDGGFVFTGSVRLYTPTPNTYENPLLVKLNSAGDIVWSKFYVGTTSDMAKDVIQTSDGGYMVVGTLSNQPNNYEVFLIKTDASGDTLWTRTFGGINYEIGYAVKQLADDSYVVFGQTQSFGAGDLDCYLLKVDPAGNLMWSKKYGGPSTDFSYGLQLTSDGGFVLAGGGGDLGIGSYDVYLIKTDSLGNSGCFETNPPTTQSFIPIQVTSAPMIVANAGFVPVIYPLGSQSRGTGMDVCQVNEAQSLNNQTVQITVSPNPFYSEIRVHSQTEGDVSLFDVAGNKILSQKINIGDVQLNTDFVPPGFYVLVFSGDKYSTYFKMAKQ